MTRQEFDTLDDRHKTPAEGYLGHVLRGGNIVGDEFMFHSTRFECVTLSSVRDLVIH